MQIRLHAQQPRWSQHRPERRSLRVAILAVSGGHTPWMMLRALVTEDVPWAAVHIVQVDERVAPDGDADRNLTHLRESLREQTSISSGQIHAMPVEAPDLNAAAAQYAMTLQNIAGSPPVLDLVHLGLGPDLVWPTFIFCKLYDCSQAIEEYRTRLQGSGDRRILLNLSTALNAVGR